MPKPIAHREDYLDTTRANLSAAIRELTSAEVFAERAHHPSAEAIRNLAGAVRVCRASLDQEGPQ
jgi:hypothetical protein